METRKSRLFALLACLFMLFANQVQAQETDDLQRLIDRAAKTAVTRAATTVTEIDLSPYSEPRTTTLYVRNGANIRFVNGTLTMSTSLNEPLIEITGESKLEVAKTAKIQGKSSSDSYTIINVLDGELDVSGGEISSPSSYAFFPGPPYYDGAVRLSSSSQFEISSGSISKIENIGCKRVYLNGGNVSLIETNTYIYVNGNNEKLHINHIVLESTEVYLIIKNLVDILENEITISGYNVNQCIAMPAAQYSITQGDVEKLSLAVWNGVFSEILSLEGNAIYVRDKLSNPIQQYDNVEPGTLPNRIQNPDIVEELTLTGKLNGTDIKLIREMACKKLRKLDISGCRIVEGGEAYLSNYTPSVNMESAIKEVGKIIIKNDYYTTDNTIGAYMFAGLSTIREISLPTNVATIQDGAFLDCPILESLVFGQINKITSGLLFVGSNELTNLTTNSSKYILKNGALYDGKTLSAVLPSAYLNNTFEIPAGIDSIAPYTFAGHSKLQRIVIPSSLTHICDYAFYLSGLKKVSLPTTVKSIGKGSFMYCSQMKEAEFSSGLERIDAGAFAYCDLRIIDLSKTQVMELLGDGHRYPIATPIVTYTYYLGVFEGNNNLLTVNLPLSIKDIGGKVFTSSAITDIYCHSNPATIWYQYKYTPAVHQLGGYGYDTSDTFVGINYKTCRLHVPSNTVSKYKEATGWKEFYIITGDQNAIADPNYIINEDDLQKRLDEIAEQAPKEPVTLTICEEGITLKKAINVKNGCKAVIMGGKITATSSVAKSDLVFAIDQAADIRFKDMTLDLSVSLPDDVNHFVNNGSLTFENTKINTEKLRVYGECRIYGYTYLPMLHLSGWGKPAIKLLSKMEDTWIIESDWEKLNVEGEPYTIVSGYNYTVTKADFSRMQFANLPNDMEAAYNDELKVVQIQKKEKECDLQSLIDGLCDANPGSVIPVPDDGVNIGCEDATDPLQCAVDKTLDGGDENDDQIEIKTLCIGCGSALFIEPAIRIYPYSSLTIRNYNIQSDKFENQSILVRGTLTIDVNVHIYHFLRFIHIVQGGRVIWRGGHLEDVDEIVHIEGGTLEIEGDFDNGGKRFVNPEGGTLIIRKGKFKGDIENHGTLIIEGGEVTGKIENDGEFRMTGGTVDGDIWSETDIWIEGGIKVTNIHIKRGCRVHVIGKLKAKWCIHFFDIDDFDIYVPILISDDDYLLTEEDFSYIEVELPDGYRCIYYKGTIVIVRIVYDVVTIVEYLNYFGPQGTLDKPWSIVYNKTNIDINIDWHILKDYHLIFDGGQFTMNGGDIYIDDGASLWLKNIRFKGVDRHIYVYGTLFIDENVDFADIVKFIHICKGGKIRFVAKPEYTVNIIVEEEHVVTDKAVIYDIIAAWLEYLHIDLPDGYEWKYDEATHTITILFTSGINDILMGRNSDEPVYDLSGNKQTKLRKGLNIISGKKVVVK